LSSEPILHQGALINELISIIRKKQVKKIVVDGTCGTGSHSLAILENFYNEIDTLYCIDIDSEILEIAKQRITSKLAEIKEKEQNINTIVNFVHNNYKNLANILSEKADIIILDLGVSYYHLKVKERGFSFESEIIDMRYDKNSGIPASVVIKNLPPDKLCKILTNYADIKNPQRFVSLLKEYFNHTKNQEVPLGVFLAKHCKKVRGRLHPATLIFQALRMYVNDEINNLKHFLNIIPQILNIEGMLFIITYHSIEDRLVKEYFKKYTATKEFSLYSKKVIKPTYQEILQNQSIRSAKLRILYRNK
jgi:16S rRNA (cytosine1402-N4)-methyltransferase